MLGLNETMTVKKKGGGGNQNLNGNVATLTRTSNWMIGNEMVCDITKQK